MQLHMTYLMDIILLVSCLNCIMILVTLRQCFSLILCSVFSCSVISISFVNRHLNLGCYLQVVIVYYKLTFMAFTFWCCFHIVIVLMLMYIALSISWLLFCNIDRCLCLGHHCMTIIIIIIYGTFWSLMSHDL